MNFFDEDKYNSYIINNNYDEAYRYVGNAVPRNIAERDYMLRLRRKTAIAGNEFARRTATANAKNDKDWQDAIIANKTFNAWKSGQTPDNLDYNNKYIANVLNYIYRFKYAGVGFDNAGNTNVTGGGIGYYNGRFRRQISRFANSIGIQVENGFKDENEYYNSLSDSDKKIVDDNRIAIRFAPKTIKRKLFGADWLDWALADINFDSDPYTTFLESNGFQTSDDLKAAGINYSTDEKTNTTTIYLDPSDNNTYRYLTNILKINDDNFNGNGIGIAVYNANPVFKKESIHGDYFSNYKNIRGESDNRDTWDIAPNLADIPGMEDFDVFSKNKYNGVFFYDGEYLPNQEAKVASKLEDIDDEGSSKSLKEGVKFGYYSSQDEELQQALLNGQITQDIYKTLKEKNENEFYRLAEHYFTAPDSDMGDIYTWSDDDTPLYDEKLDNEGKQALLNIIAAYRHNNDKLMYEFGRLGDKYGLYVRVSGVTGDNDIKEGSDKVKEFNKKGGYFFIENFIPPGGEEQIYSAGGMAVQDLNNAQEYDGEIKLDDGGKITNVGVIKTNVFGEEEEGAFYTDKSGNSTFISMSEATKKVESKYRLEDAVFDLKQNYYNPVTGEIDVSDENLESLSQKVKDKAAELAVLLNSDLVDQYSMYKAQQDEHNLSIINEEFEKRQNEIYEYLTTHLNLK